MVELIKLLNTMPADRIVGYGILFLIALYIVCDSIADIFRSIK